MKKTKWLQDRAFLEIYSKGFESIWKEWLEHRKSKKKPFTTIKSEERSFNKVVKMAKDEQNAIELVEHAIDRGWQSFFPLPNQSQATNYQPPIQEIVKEQTAEERKRLAEKMRKLGDQKFGEGRHQMNKAKIAKEEEQRNAYIASGEFVG